MRSFLGTKPVHRKPRFLREATAIEWGLMIGVAGVVAYAMWFFYPMLMTFLLKLLTPD